MHFTKTDVFIKLYKGSKHCVYNKRFLGSLKIVFITTYLILKPFGLLEVTEIS